MIHSSIDSSHSKLWATRLIRVFFVLFTLFLSACNTPGGQNLLVLPDYEQLLIRKSDLKNYLPDDLTAQMSTDMRLLDTALPSIRNFAKCADILPDEFTFRHLQYEFLLSQHFEKAYGVWDKEIHKKILSDDDEQFGISLTRDSLLMDSDFVKLRDDYLNLIDTIIDISNGIYSQSKNLSQISIMKDGLTLLDTYSQEAIVKWNVPAGFFESSVLTGVPYVFSRQDMFSKGKDIGIRRMGDHIEIFYPNFSDSFEIDFIYQID